MHLRFFILAAATSMAGCASDQLRFTANRQMSTTPDIYNRQVLDNLSRIMGDPACLPYFNTLDSGVPQVADKGTVSGLILFPAQSLVKQLHNQRGGQVGPITGERDITVNWTMKPVSDESRLRAMRCLYLWVLDKPLQEGYEKSQTRVGNFYIDQNGDNKFDFSDVGQGWIQRGRWQDVPKNAVHVMHHHRTYCWVVLGREDALTDLSLRMLRIAIAAKRTKTVVRSYYNQQGRLVQTETSVEKVDGIAEPGYMRSNREITEREEAVVARMLKELNLQLDGVPANPDENGEISHAIIQTIHQKSVLDELDKSDSKPFEEDDFVERVLQPLVAEKLVELLRLPRVIVDAALGPWNKRSLWRDLRDVLSDIKDTKSLNESPDADLTVDTLPFDVTPGLVTAAPH
jgi:hypothetical protein